MGLVAAEKRRELHHEGLGHDEASVHLEVGGHPLGVDVETVDEIAAAGHSAAGVGHQQRQRVPLHLPLAGRPLVATGHGPQGHRREGAGHPAEAHDRLGQDGVGLLGHRGGCAGQTSAPLTHFGDLAAGQVDDLQGDTAHGRGQHAKSGRERRAAVPDAVPGLVVAAEAQDLGGLPPRLGTQRPVGRRRARRPVQLDDLGRRPRLA